MDHIDDLLRAYFDPSQAPPTVAVDLARRADRTPTLDAEATVARFRIEASARGVRRLSVASRGALAGDRRHAERARRLTEGVELSAELLADLRARVGAEP